MRRVLWAAVAVGLGVLPALAAPPELAVKGPDKSEPCRLVTVTAETTAKVVKWKVIGDATAEFDSGGRKVFLVGKGKVTVLAVAASDTGELSEFKEWVGEFGGKPDDGGGKPDDGGTKPPPVNPPGDPKFFFVVVRPDGPVSAVVRQSLTLPAWADVRKAGHEMKDYEAKDSPKGIPVPATLPAVVVLRVSTDGKTSTVVGDPRPLPATDDAVRGLLK